MTPAFETMQRESAICFPFLGSWTINPPAYITVFGRNIYLYGILIALGFVLAIAVCARIAPKFGISADSFYDLAIWMIHSRGEAVFCGLPLGLLRGASG